MDSRKVTAAKPKVGGAVFRAPLGTELPTSATGALNAAFKNLGHCSDSGLKNSNSPASESVKAWGGEVVLNNQTERPDTFQLMLIEAMNEEVLKVVYGDSNVEGTLNGEGIHVKVTGQELQEYAWVVDMILKNGNLKRVVVPQAKVTALAEITYADNSPVGYDITLSATACADGAYHHEYICKPPAAQTQSDNSGSTGT